MNTGVIKDTHFQMIADYAKPDSKNRITLGVTKLAEIVSSGYAVYRNNVGQIVLDPVNIIPTSEMWLYQNKKALASVRRGWNNPAKAKSTKLTCQN